MPKVKTSRAAAKRFKTTGTEPYLNQEISEEKKKPEKTDYC